MIIENQSRSPPPPQTPLKELAGKAKRAESLVLEKLAKGLNGSWDS